MRRSGRKRKLSETLVDDYGLTTEIKIEPTEIQFSDDALLTDPYCCLCKTSAGDKLAVFDSEPKYDADIASKIQSCSGLEISSEVNPDAHICRRCLQQLDCHYAFQKQASKCNKYTQTQMAGDDSSDKTGVCRFCLKTDQMVLDMYPSGESPELDLLQKIRECLVIELNSWDPVTKICRSCIEGIDSLLEFRTKYHPASVYIKDEIMPGPSKNAKMIKQEDEDTSKQEYDDLDLDLSVSDSDCSLGENEHTDPLIAEQQKTGVMRPELLQLIGSETDGRNFTVLKDDCEQMKVIFDDHRFRFHSERKHGPSLWLCDNVKLRGCKMKLEIDANGRCAELLASVGCHSHPPGTAKLMQCPFGRGVTEVSGKTETFYMFCSSPAKTNYTRSLILQRFRYFLHQIRQRGVSSVWHCVHRWPGNCKVKLIISGIFEKVVIDGKHNHRELGQHRIEPVLINLGIDMYCSAAISEFQRVNTIKMINELRNTAASAEFKEKTLVEMKSLVKEKNPEIFGILEQDEVERNFEVIKTGEKIKLKHNSFEYRYYGKLADNCSVWKCIMDSLRHCMVLAKVTPDGKHLEIYNRKHSHKSEPEEVFSYPIGKRMVGEEPLWLLTRVSLYYESRYVIFKDYIFIMQEVNRKGQVRWCCLRKHSCRALLVTKGNFQEVVPRNIHSHEKPPESMITKLINGTSELDAGNLTFKQKLLFHPSTKTKIWNEGENKYETLYILTDANKGSRSVCGFIFRGNKYKFGSLDQNETSRWLCWKADSDYRRKACKVTAVVEGLFASILVANEHAHEVMSDSMIDHLIKRSVSLPNSSGKKAANLEELPERKRQAENILSILTRQDPDRNFSVARTKNKLLVSYEGEDFRLKSRDAEGASTWSCIWLKVRICLVSLQMSADGKHVSYSDTERKHNHADEQIGVFLQAPGKATIYDEDKDSHLYYWLYSFQTEFRASRGIIYQGFKFIIHGIGNNGISTWKCRSGCKAYVRIGDSFDVISCKNTHNHHRLTDDEIKTVTGQKEVDKDLLPSSEANSKTVSSTGDGPLRLSAIMRIMSLDDPDRNFKVKMHKDQIKIFQKGYEYYYRSSTPTHTLWRCIYSSIRGCRATLQVGNDCKRGFLPDFPKHNHFHKLWDIYNYPLGESKIMDSYTKTVKPFWFIMQPTFIRSIPNIIYDDHRYTMAFITEKGDNSKWKCVAFHCSAKLTVTGMFEMVVSCGNSHLDPPITQERQAELVKLYGTFQPSTDELGAEIPFVKVEMNEDDFYEHED